MDLNFLDKSYPMSMGLDAVKEITEKLGCSLEQLSDTISAAGIEDKFVMYAQMAEAMMRSASRRKKLESIMFGEEYQEEKIPTAEEILCIYDLLTGKKLTSAVLQTMNESQNGTVEMKESKRKNAESHA